jgi:hypothetical protein
VAEALEEKRLNPTRMPFSDAGNTCRDHYSGVNGYFPHRQARSADVADIDQFLQQEALADGG